MNDCLDMMNRFLIDRSDGQSTSISMDGGRNEDENENENETQQVQMIAKSCRNTFPLSASSSSSSVAQTMELKVFGLRSRCLQNECKASLVLRPS